MERTTSQKEFILNYLKNTKVHPTAETVYLEAKKNLPRISKSTVYRILNKLTEKKQIQEILGGITRYDGNISNHAHFICQKCGQVSDIFEKYEELNNKKIKNNNIKGYQVYFYGDCFYCKKL